MFGFIKRIQKLEDEIVALKKENTELKVEVEEVKKKTVSKMTTQPDESVSFSQIMDEWLNGGKEESNGD